MAQGTAMQNSTEYDAFVRGMIQLGWDRHWITNNEPALRQAFDRDPRPFPPPPRPERKHDRYAEL